MVSPAQLGSTSRLDIGACILLHYFRPAGDLRSVGGEVSIDYDDVCDDFVGLKMMYQLSPSEVLIEIGCACVHL